MGVYKINETYEFDKLMQHLGLMDSPRYEDYRKLAIFRDLKKNEVFFEDDANKQHIDFLVSGVLRGFFVDKKGHDVTDCFAFRYGQTHIGFLNAGVKHIASGYAEAIVPSKLICFNMNDLMPLIFTTLELSNLYCRKLTESYVDHWIHKTVLYNSTAAERYQWFLTAYPGLIDIVPHKYIASFLTMTPVTLSRIRQDIKEDDESPTIYNQRYTP